MLDVTALRARATKNFADITAGLENSAVKSYDDPRIWKIDKDKAGNGSAIIRFLDISEGDDMPWVRIFSHSFKINGNFYIENSLSTFGIDVPDPVLEWNRDLWDSTPDDDKSWQRNQARSQKRKTSYYSNILVIKDPRHPENEGKVFLFKYGVKIYQKITAKLAPQFEDEAPVNVFDYWAGADFKLRVKTTTMSYNGKEVAMPNYDDSSFSDMSSPAAPTDEEIVAIAAKQYSLKELLDPKHFKTYEELAKRLALVRNGAKRTVYKGDQDGSGGSVQEEAPTPEDDDIPRPREAVRAPKVVATKGPVFDADDDDAAVEYFKKLAAGMGDGASA